MIEQKNEGPKKGEDNDGWDNTPWGLTRQRHVVQTVQKGHWYGGIKKRKPGNTIVVRRVQPLDRKGVERGKLVKGDQKKLGPRQLRTPFWEGRRQTNVGGTPPFGGFVGKKGHRCQRKKNTWEKFPRLNLTTGLATGLRTHCFGRGAIPVERRGKPTAEENRGDIRLSG